MKKGLKLVASSMHCPRIVRECGASLNANIVTEGYIGNRIHNGNEQADAIERNAIQSAKRLFKAQYANVQPHSASTANIGIFLNLLNYKDTIMTMSLKSGGHLTHGMKNNVVHKYLDVKHYTVDKQTQLLDYDHILDRALATKPKLIVAGASSYSRAIDFQRMRQIADQVNAILYADISHIAGLVVTSEHQSPIDHAHITVSSTYKSLASLHGGVVLLGKDYKQLYCGKELHKWVDDSIFPFIQSTSDFSHTFAKHVAFEYCNTPAYTSYMKRVRQYASIMADRLINKHNCFILTGGTDNHMFMIDCVKSFGMNGAEAADTLERINIIVTRTYMPYDGGICSGIRIGTNCLAQRDNIVLKELHYLADIIVDYLRFSVTPEESTKSIQSFIESNPINNEF